MAKIINEEQNRMKKEITEDITKVRDYINTIITTSNEEGITKAIKYFVKLFKIKFEDKFEIDKLSLKDKEILLRDIGENIIEEY